MGDSLTTRQVSPGLHWIPACLVVAQQGKVHHSHNAPYLIVGDERSALIDTGPPRHRGAILSALDALLAGRALDFVFPTHPELPHAGNLGALVERYPDIVVCGDVSDYHLFFSGIEPHLMPLRPGDRLELGGTRMVAVEAVIRDLPNTLWAYDERSKTLFVGDALGFSHHHEAGECTLTSEELPQPPTVAQIGYLNDGALYWTRFVDLEPYFARFDAVVDRYPIDAMASAHGAFISDPHTTVPLIKAGMRIAREQRRESMGIPTRATAPGAAR